MATVVKDFKIKSGLVVEGTTGTINNFDILTKKEDDQQFIIDLIGGETLVKSVSNEFDVSVGGELSLDRAVVDTYYDAAGSADTAEDNAIAHTDAREVAITTAYEAYADQAELDAVATAEAYTDGRETAITTAYQNYADTAEQDAVTTANAYTDGRETAITSAYQTYADQAETDAKAYTDTRETAITTAYQSYADQAEVDAKAYTDTRETAITTAYQSYADTAEQDAKDYADQAVSDLVNGAPALLDTLNELAAALQDNPDVITDLQDIAAGKQDTLTAGSNIDITGATISVTGLDTDDVAEGTNLYFTDARALTATAFAYDVAGSAVSAQENAENYADGLAVNYDAAGSAATAEQNAKDYADGLAPNYDPSGAAFQALTDANAYTDTTVNGLDTDDIEEGATNLYFTDNRAKDSAGDLLANAITTNVDISYVGGVLTVNAESGVADSDTDDLDEGENNLYFTDNRAFLALQGTESVFQTVSIDEVALQVASSLSAPTAGVQTAYAWAKSDYRSAEFLVKVAHGTHTEISKVLLTLDTSDNIAITEYGIVGTNGSASSISAGVSGNNVQLLVTTTNNTSTVTVVGTLLV